MSQFKSDTARANGAKSHGPATPAGKAKSAGNSLRHGLSAQTIVLPGESAGDFQALLAAHVQRFRPADSIEMDLVESMAVARWRLRRIASIEANMLANAMSDTDRLHHAPQNHDQRLARVFKDCSGQIDLLTRYEGSLNRTFDRALRQLQLLQRTPSAPPREELQNEPKPAPSGHEEDLPGGHGESVGDHGSSDPAPHPESRAIEDPGNSRQSGETPVGESAVPDVDRAEQKGSRD